MIWMVCVRTKFLHPHVTNSIEIINKQTDKVYRSENRIIRRRSQVEKKHRSRYQHFLFVSKGIFVNFMIFFFSLALCRPWQRYGTQKCLFFHFRAHGIAIFGVIATFNFDSPVLFFRFASISMDAQNSAFTPGKFSLRVFFFSPNDCFYVCAVFYVYMKNNKLILLTYYLLL